MVNRINIYPWSGAIVNCITVNSKPAQGTQAFTNISNQPGKLNTKRKRDDELELSISYKTKKVKVSKPLPGRSIQGFLWDSENWSCA